MLKNSGHPVNLRFALDHAAQFCKVSEGRVIPKAARSRDKSLRFEAGLVVFDFPRSRGTEHNWPRKTLNMRHLV
jgi:hypothetical protein